MSHLYAHWLSFFLYIMAGDFFRKVFIKFRVDVDPPFSLVTVIQRSYFHHPCMQNMLDTWFISLSCGHLTAEWNTCSLISEWPLMNAVWIVHELPELNIGSYVIHNAILVFLMCYPMTPSITEVHSVGDVWANECGAVKWYWQGKTELLGEIPVPSSLCPPRIQDSLARNWARASSVKSGNWASEWWQAHLGIWNNVPLYCHFLMSCYTPIILVFWWLILSTEGP